MNGINHNWGGKKVQIIDIDGKLFTGIVDHTTGKEDNDETGRDSLTMFDGLHYIFFSDNEIKSIEIID